MSTLPIRAHQWSMSAQALSDEIEKRTIYSDESGTILYENKQCNLYLTSDQLRIYDFNSVNRKPIDIINLKNVIGSIYLKRNGKYVLEIYRYEYRSRGCFSTKQMLREKSTLYFTFNVSDHKVLLNWSNAINCASYNQLPLQKNEDGSSIASLTRRKSLVYVNPVSGKGNASNIWGKIVKPMFSEASIDVVLIITERRNHCYEHIQTYNLNDIDFITTISGDGLIYELINGLDSRSDRDRVLASIPLAPIAGGSGNGLSKSILFASHEDMSSINGAFVAIKGSKIPIDLSTVQTKVSTTRSFLSLGWGLISDIDISSEFMRPLGELRFHAAAVYFVIAGNAYRGRLSMMLKHDDHVTSPSITSMTLPAFDVPLSNAYQVNERNDSWHVIEADFTFVWILQTSHSSESVYSGPGVSLNDGVFTIVVGENLSRVETIQVLLSFETGDHIRHPRVKVFKSIAYRLEPLTDKGILSLDGELVEYGPIQGVINPSAACVFSL